MPKIEFFFDCSSPWTYLGFESLLTMHGFAACEVQWRPFLVGGVFNSVNPSVYENRQNPVPAKQAYYQKDLQDWARFVGIEIGAPPVFPVNSVRAMRGAFVAMEAGVLESYARAVFRSYWTQLRDISQPQEIAAIVAEVGLDLRVFEEKINSQEYKDKLRANTEELIERGGFGSPTFFLNDNDMYFGNDRLVVLQHKVAQLLSTSN